MGWLNFRDAGSPAAAQGTRLLSTHLRGIACGESIGWINSDTPVNVLRFCHADLDGHGRRTIDDTVSPLNT